MLLPYLVFPRKGSFFRRLRHLCRPRIPRDIGPAVRQKPHVKDQRDPQVVTQADSLLAAAQVTWSFLDAYF